LTKNALYLATHFFFLPLSVHGLQTPHGMVLHGPQAGSLHLVVGLRMKIIIIMEPVFDYQNHKVVHLSEHRKND
jgi:hypothetical protein